jgi:uncharacterized protein (DUF58 family)
MNFIPKEINFLPADVAIIIAEAKRLELKMRGFASASYIQGINRCRYGLLSQDVVDHRPYVSGDDPRHIDWRSFARTDRYFVNTYRYESARNILIALDVSRSMEYKGGAQLNKLEYAKRIVAALATIAIRKNNRIALTTTQDSTILYGNSNGHLLKILRSLFLASHQKDKEQPLTQLLPAIAKSRLVPDAIFIVSDCFSDKPSELYAFFKKVAPLRADVVIFQVLANEELLFPFNGEVNLRDLEMPDIHLIGNAEKIRDGYLSNLRAFLNTLSRECYRAGIEYTIFKTSLPLMMQVSHFLLKRKYYKINPLLLEKRTFS